MRHQLGGLLDKFPVNRVLYLALDGNRNGLVHFVAYNEPNSFFSTTSGIFHEFMIWLGEPEPHQLPLLMNFGLLVGFGGQFLFQDGLKPRNQPA